MITENILKNIEQLQNYKYYFGPIPNTINVNEAASTSLDNLQIDKNITKDCTIICNEININRLTQLEKATFIPKIMKWKKMPVYLYFDLKVLHSFLLQPSEEVESLLNTKRVVILAGIEYAKDFFENMQAVLPKQILGDTHNNITALLKNLKVERSLKLKGYREEIKQYYHENSSAIIKRASQKCPKILFLTTRFVEGERVKYCYEECKRLGFDCEIAIENDDIYRIYYEQAIAEYKPDIIFAASKFRFEFPYLPDEVIFATWRNDKTLIMFDSTIPSKLKQRDIIFDMSYGHNVFCEHYGYDRNNMYAMPLPGNDQLYREYELTDEELSKYSCDVCFVSNNTNINKFIKPIISKYDDTVNVMVNEIIADLIVRNYEENCIWLEADWNRFLMYYIDKHCVNYKNLDLDLLREEIWIINYSIQKIVLTRWLTEKENIKLNLWGLDWDELEEFKDYSKGYAKAGEELSKIYQASKICIGSHHSASLVSRTTEIIFSRAFMLKNEIPNSVDEAPCEKFFDVGKDIIVYKNRDDLYKKIDYYLEHEEERRAVAQRAYKKAKKFLTYRSLIKNLVDTVSEKFNLSAVQE